MARPVIVYVEREMKSNDLDNSDRGALVYLFGVHCGCEVVLYDSVWEFEGDLRKVRLLAESERVALFIFAQEKYSDDHKRAIKLVRRKLQLDIPIAVVSNVWDNRCRNSSARKIRVFCHDDPKLLELASDLVLRCRPRGDWLGAETAADQAVLYRQLETVYRKNYLGPNEELVLAVPDVNGQVVAEALRIKLLPVELVKEEFDDKLERPSHDFGQVAVDIYETEVARIHAMNDSERRKFDDDMSRAMGREPLASGGYFVRRVGLGDDIAGFAIDPVTLETTTTSGFGLHHFAKDQLFYRIRHIESFRHRDKGGLTEKLYRECHWRLIGGLILQMRGFASPIIVLYQEDSPDSDLKKVAGYILRQRKFIPVTADGQLIEG